ncbi:MAG: TOBE domain-containing protein [Negativibacillus massiliensis]|nr:TOBE domain-containing protein [Negativibacillus massiliensis]
MNIWEEEGKILGIRPEHIHVTLNSDHIQAKVMTVEHTGREKILFVLTQRQETLAVLAGVDCSLKEGDRCFLQMDREFLHQFDPDNGRRIL